MFNVEKLLGKIVQQAIGGGKNSIIENLASSSGLMTAIGLGVGAFEILRDKSHHSAPPPPPPSHAAASHSAPPPLPAKSDGQPVPPEVPDHADPQQISDLAIRMIQVIIAAANADGRLDGSERESILKQFEKAELSKEETDFLLAEMHSPRSIEELTADITDPDISKVMYSLAIQCVPVDSTEERAWFDQLATALALDNTVKNSIESRA